LEPLPYECSLAGQADLTSILKRQIVPCVVYLGELDQSEIKLGTLEGVTLTVQRHNWKFRVNGVPVVRNDVFGSNGAMNFVDQIVTKEESIFVRQTERLFSSIDRLLKHSWKNCHTNNNGIASRTTKKCPTCWFTLLHNLKQFS